jgi:hypothetical protein
VGAWATGTRAGEVLLVVTTGRHPPTVDENLSRSERMAATMSVSASAIMLATTQARMSGSGKTRRAEAGCPEAARARTKEGQARCNSIATFSAGETMPSAMGAQTCIWRGENGVSVREKFLWVHLGTDVAVDGGLRRCGAPRAARVVTPPVVLATGSSSALKSDSS